MPLYRGEVGLDSAWLNLAQNCAHVAKASICNGHLAQAQHLPKPHNGTQVKVYAQSSLNSSKYFKHVQNGKGAGKERLHAN